MTDRLRETPAGLPQPPSPPPGIAPERRVVAASAVLYALSLALPAISETHPDGVGAGEQGYLILAMGWMGMVMGQVAWFANPLWFVGAVLLWRRKWRRAAVVSLLAVLVGAASFFLYRTGLPSDSGETIRAGLLAGFWAWWGSLWMLAAGALLLWRRAGEARSTVGA